MQSAWKWFQSELRVRDIVYKSDCFIIKWIIHLVSVQFICICMDVVCVCVYIAIGWPNVKCFDWKCVFDGNDRFRHLQAASIDVFKCSIQHTHKNGHVVSLIAKWFFFECENESHTYVKIKRRRNKKNSIEHKAEFVQCVFVSVLCFNCN